MILSLETSTRSCSLAVHNKGQLLGNASFHLDKSHSALLPSTVGQLLDNLEIRMEQLEAVGVSEGPGSYTGLRIGASVAKGLSYALGKPLISIPTLLIIAEEVAFLASENTYIVPMLDARRMEVYGMVVGKHGKVIEEVSPWIIDENSLSQYKGKDLWLIGNGAQKCEGILSHSSYTIIPEAFPDAKNMGAMAFRKFKDKDFQEAAYFEPFYLKPFQTKKAKNRLLQ